MLSETGKDSVKLKLFDLTLELMEHEAYTASQPIKCIVP